MDVEPEEKFPPDIFWHGTGEKFVSSIEKQGLLPKNRLYLHLSSAPETARNVGIRYENTVIFCVDYREMTQDGDRFYLSANKVRLIKEILARDLTKIEGKTRKDSCVVIADRAAFGAFVKKA